MGGMNRMALDAAVVIGRGLALAVACISFYIAFFLYENEEGALRNRIDDLWIAVDERARVTDNRSTALFNKIALKLVSASVAVFGKALVSVRMFAVSTNLSMAGAGLMGVTLCLTIYRDVFIFSRRDLSIIFLGSVVFLAIALIVIRFPRRWVAAAACVPFWAAVCLVLIAVAGRGGGGIWYGPANGFEIAMIQGYAESVPFALVFSLLSDALAIVAIRRLFASIAKSLSFGRILRLIGLLAAILLAIGPGLCIGLGALSYEISNDNLQSVFRVGVIWVGLLNTTTALYCLIPVIMLLVVLLHRLLWPVLGRLIYPFARYRLLANRKAMASIGGVSLAIALNLEHVGLKEIIQLFS